MREALAPAALAGALALAAIVGAHAQTPPGDTRAPVADVDPEVVRRLRALDPERISATDVAEVLARVPAPRIVLLEGSIALVNMDSFAEYLMAMGYPGDRIRSPRDGRMSGSSFTDSRQLAGMVAWYYEAEGMPPILIGHSKGGALVISVLYELAGELSDSIHVWNPLTDREESRTTIVDPATGDVRPVVVLRLRYAAALATGKLPRLLTGQWWLLSRLRRIPDSVEDFTGFSIEWDMIAGDFGGSDPYTPIGTATVRNVTLPASYTHIGLPRVEHLAANPVTRAWIDAYDPRAHADLPDPQAADTTNIVHAADIWHSVKKAWCVSARQRLSASRATQ